MKKTRLSVYISAFISSSVVLPFYVHAQDTASSNQTTDVMLVTATKRTDPVTNLVAPIIEITKQQIEDSQANNLTEVLRQLPGIQITTTGGDSQTTRVYVRGSNNVVVLFNGMRLGSASSGFSDVSQLPLAGIQKIEYLRGSRAAVYGADATAGVINIKTNGNNTKSTGSLKATGGSDGYQNYTGTISMVPSDKAWVNLTAQYQHADNYNVNSYYDDDKDGFENTNIVGDWGVRLQDNWLIRINGFYHNGVSEYDSVETDPSTYLPINAGYNYRSKTENYNINGQVIYTTDTFTSNLTYGYSQDKSVSVAASSRLNATTQRNEVNWRNNWLFTDSNSLGFGLEYVNDDLSESSTRYDETERYNQAGYINLAHNGDVLQLEGSVRLDDNEQFGDKTTWQLGAGWQIVNQLRLTTNIGTGFKVPTFNDLYYPDFSNPNLEPEESTNYEVALEGEHSFLSWRLAGFYNDIDNRIVYSSTNSNYQNINEDLTIKGIEWVGRFDTGPLHHQVSLQYLDPEDKATGEDAIRIARQSYKWQVGYQGENWQANMSYEYQGKRYDTAYYPDYSSERVKLDGYSLVNLAASYNLTDQWVVSGRINNLFDADYETVATYIEPERSYYGSIAYQF